MLWSVILTVLVFATLRTADIVLDGEDDNQFEESFEDYLEPAVVALICGAIQYSTPLLPESLMILAPVFMLVMIGSYVWLCRWAAEEVGYFKEMIPFIVAAILFQFPMSTAAAATAKFMNVGFIAVIPAIAVVVAIGFMLFDFFSFRKELGEKDGDEKLNGRLQIASAAIAGVLALALAVNAIGSPAMTLDMDGQPAEQTEVANAAEQANTTEQQPDQKAEAAQAIANEDQKVEAIQNQSSKFWNGVHFYNADLQNDGKKGNGFNFGPNPEDEGEGKSFYHNCFKKRRANDPALLAATCVALDCTIGTDYIGEILYEGYDERLNMLEKADAAARVLATNEDLFDQTNESVNKLFGMAKVKLKTMSDIDDQLFMNPASVSGIPQIVFYKANFDDGLVLVYTFQIKGGSNTKAKVMFHIPCGFQWCNAAEKLDVKPEEAPAEVKSGSDGGTKKRKHKEDHHDDTRKKKNDTTTRKKDDDSIERRKKTSEDKIERKKPNKPSYNKDPEKAPKKNTEPNDDKGPGKDTNTGGNKSSEEQKHNSTSKDSYEDYKKDVGETKKVNEEQKKGGDSNEPSTKPSSSDTKVDNNGDKGTGHGGADKPTPKQDKPKETKNDSAGDSWDGPSD